MGVSADISKRSSAPLADDGQKAAVQVTRLTLGQLLELPVSELGVRELALRNLLCATNLPDTHDLDLGAYMSRFDQWVLHVERETNRNLHHFHRSPAQYANSEAYWRAGMMITVLQQDLGVRYDAECIRTQDFKNSSEGFIHGILAGRGGTCANLPVLYGAIGRRLGYPIYLCCAKRHLFNRWESADGRERFNIEGSGFGFSSFPDDYYMRGRYSTNEGEVRAGFYLRNLDPAEEVAAFMAIRGHCLRDHGLLLDAIVAYAQAHRLAPAQPPHFYSMMEAINHELRLHAEGSQPNSYRDWEGWNRIPRPRQVLEDSFDRIDRSRPVFRPEEVIVTPGFLQGDNHV